MRPPSLIFILGLHRTGTTVLYQLLAETNAFAVLTAEDVVALSDDPTDRAERNGRIAAKFADLRRAGVTSRGIDTIPLGPGTPEEYGFVLSNRERGWSLSRGSLAEFNECCATLRRRAPNHPLLLKNPWDFGNAAWIHAQFPEAAFVFLHRDPFEMLGSTVRMMRAYLQERNAYLAILSEPYRRFVEAQLPFRFSRWVCERRPEWILRAAVWHASRQVRRYLRDRPQLPVDRSYDLRYEDLCGDPPGSLSGLLAFLGVRADASPLAARVQRPAPRIVPEVLRHCRRLRGAFAEYAQRFGYGRALSGAVDGGAR